MTPSNLGVCFGPTLLRTAEESVAAILDIKFVNVIAELIIENYEQVFLVLFSFRLNVFNLVIVWIFIKKFEFFLDIFNKACDE